VALYSDHAMSGSSVRATGIGDIEPAIGRIRTEEFWANSWREDGIDEGRGWWGCWGRGWDKYGITVFGLQRFVIFRRLFGHSRGHNIYAYKV